MHKYFICFICFCFITEPAYGQYIHTWDLRNITQAGQMTFYNPDRNDAQFGTPISSSDLNGDGRAEFIVSAMAADGTPENIRTNVGEIHIYFSNGSIVGKVDFLFDNINVVEVIGEAEDDIFGIKHTSGDVDNDGLNDLMVGAFYADGLNGADSGKLYIFSSQLLTDLLNGTHKLDLANPFPSGVRTISGPHAGSRMGVWMAAGDINGDGIDDVVVGADQSDGFNPSHKKTGRVYVYYGPLAPDVQIDAADTTQNMTIIYGIDPVDNSGSCLTTGDINGDGYDDIIIGAGAFGTLRNAYDREGGAGDGPGNTRENAGEIRVVFGKPDLPLHIDLRSDPPEDMLSIYGRSATPEGRDSPDRLGEEVITADINGDGLADILAGAYRADSKNKERPDGGDVYIIYGNTSLPGQTLDMEDAPPDVTVIYGSKSGAIAGDSIAAGDIHNDGFDDLFIGIPGDTGPNGRRIAGGIVVMSGGPSLPNEIDLASPSVPAIWVEGVDPFDYSAYWSAAGDVNGDGHIDPMPNGMAGDGPDNRRNNSGEAYIINGAVLANILPGHNQTDEDTTDTTDDMNDSDVIIAEQPALLPNYPNPFNSGTTLRFTLPMGISAHTTLSLYNLRGQRIRVLIDETMSSGLHVYTWDGADADGRLLPSGTYFCELKADGYRDRKKLVIVR